jgi:Fe-S cluster assembly protein SufD
MSHAAALPQTRRAQAATLFRARGIPHRRIEAWKYSDLRGVLGEAGAGEGAAAWTLGALPDGVEVFDLSRDEAPAWVRDHFGAQDDGVLGAASLAYATGGVALHVTRALAQPLTLEFSGAGHVRALLVMEAGASATLLESAGDAPGFRNVGFEIVLGAGARLSHLRTAPAAEAARVEGVFLTLAKDALYHAHFTDMGSRLSRLDVKLILNGAGARADLSGASVLDGSAHADVTTHVVHAVGGAQSDQLFKYIANGHARGVYQGKVTVAKGADGSDSLQTAKGLLLGERAEIDLKPELEILAEDVKCAHGAAVGDLDVESLFYLRSRGVPENEARALLMRAFLGDAIDRIEAEDLRDTVRRTVEEALGALV